VKPVLFIVPGRPVPKKRPRLGYRGRRVYYTPEETKAYEQHVGWVARPKFERPFEGPVIVRLRFFVAAKGRARGDLDNYTKAVLDSVTGIAFRDDSQVVKIEAELFECPSSLERVEVEIEQRAEAEEAS